MPPTSISASSPTSPCLSHDSSLSSELHTPSPTQRRPGMAIDPMNRSVSSLMLHTTPPHTSPKVQLVPFVHRLSYDSSFSQMERDIVDNTSFDAFDLSSQDFDFEDIFTYDKPQRNHPPGMEAIAPSREQDWSTTSHSHSHYTPAPMTRQKANRNRSGLGEMYVKNKIDARRR